MWILTALIVSFEFIYYRNEDFTAGLTATAQVQRENESMQEKYIFTLDLGASHVVSNLQGNR